MVCAVGPVAAQERGAVGDPGPAVEDLEAKRAGHPARGVAACNEDARDSWGERRKDAAQRFANARLSLVRRKASLSYGHPGGGQGRVVGAAQRGHDGVLALHEGSQRRVGRTG
jgi:hypothetical protein